MLLGMAGYKIRLPDRRVERPALPPGGAGRPRHRLCRLIASSPRSSVASGFRAARGIHLAIAAIRPVPAADGVGYAALFILMIRRRGWLRDRIAAVGRAAFSNYLGTSILIDRPVLRLGLASTAKPRAPSCGCSCRSCGR